MDGIFENNYMYRAMIKYQPFSQSTFVLQYLLLNQIYIIIIILYIYLERYNSEYHVLYIIIYTRALKEWRFFNANLLFDINRTRVNSKTERKKKCLWTRRLS